MWFMHLTALVLSVKMYTCFPHIFPKKEGKASCKKWAHLTQKQTWKCRHLISGQKLLWYCMASHIHMYIRMHTHTHRWRPMYTHIYIYIYTQFWQICTHKYKHMYTYTCKKEGNMFSWTEFKRSFRYVHACHMCYCSWLGSVVLVLCISSAN